MSHQRSRISRNLFIALSITVLAGLLVYVRNQRKSLPPRAVAEPAINIVAKTVTATAPVAEASMLALVAETAPAPAPALAQGLQTHATTQPAAPLAPLAAAVAVTPVQISGVPMNPLGEGRRRLEAGDLLASRKVLNDALVSGQLSASDAAEARRLISQANQSIIFSPRRFADDPYAIIHTVQSGEKLANIAGRNSITWEFLARLNGLADPRKMRAGQSLKIIKGPFNAVVNKSSFTMDLYLGEAGKPSSLYVTSFSVGLGSNDSTPTGAWLVEPQHKLKNPTYYSPRGQGIIDADDPKNPLGEHWIGLAGIDGHAVGQRSYGIHGTIEPSSIGKQSSLGCIRMRNEDVAVVFDLLVEGKSVVVVRD